jgi:hypothetical protein
MPRSKSAYPCGAWSTVMTVALTALANIIERRPRIDQRTRSAVMSIERGGSAAAPIQRCMISEAASR